jgi:DNA-binding transcriptional ArsR family regulator
MTSTADLLLHPVRLRIVQAFLGHRQLTTASLREHLPDVPQATLYRHIARLTGSGVLRVVETRQVRGATERTYALEQERVSVDPDEVRAMTRDQQRAAFVTYLASLVDAFDQYLAGDDPDLLRDLVSFRVAGMQVTDDELMETLMAFRERMTSLVERDPPAGARRRLLATITFPADRS